MPRHLISDASGFLFIRSTLLDSLIFFCKLKGAAIAILFFDCSGGKPGTHAPRQPREESDSGNMERGCGMGKRGGRMLWVLWAALGCSGQV